MLSIDERQLANIAGNFSLVPGKCYICRRKNGIGVVALKPVLIVESQNIAGFNTGDGIRCFMG